MSDLVRDCIAAELLKLERLVRIPTASGRGVDLVCVDDIDSRFTETDPEGLNGLAQDCYHRITTKRGSVPDAKDFGIDLREYLSKPMGELERMSLAIETQSEVLKDDRVLEADVDVTLPTLNTMRVRLRIKPRNPDLQTFTLIIAVADGETHLEALQR